MRKYFSNLLTEVRVNPFLVSFLVLIIMMSMAYSHNIFANDTVETVVIMDTTPPKAPTGLTGTVNEGIVTLKWIDNSSNEAGFKIYRGPTWAEAGKVGSNITTFTDTSQPSGTYIYRVNAFNSVNIYSPISNDVLTTVAFSTNNVGFSITNITPAITLPEVPTLPSPTNLTAIVGACNINSISLSWQNGGTEAVGYKIYRGDTLMYATSGLGYIESSLTPGTTYVYKVSAFNPINGASSAFVTTTATTPPACVGVATTNPQTTPLIPQAPTELALNGTPSTHSIPLKWKDNSNNEDRFIIERKSTIATAWNSLGQEGVNKTTHNDIYVTPETSYDYKIRTCSVAGCSTYATLSGVMSPAEKVATVVQDKITPSEATTTTEIKPPLSTTIKKVIPPVTIKTTNPSTVTTNLKVETKPSIETTPSVLNNVITPDRVATREEALKSILMTADTKTLAPALNEIKPTTTLDTDNKPETVVVTRNIQIQAVSQMQNLNTVIETINDETEKTKQELVKIVDKNIAEILADGQSSGINVSKIDLYANRDKLIERINFELTGIITISSDDILKIEGIVNFGLREIRLSALKDSLIAGGGTTTSVDTKQALGSLVNAIQGQSSTFKSQGGALLYQDSNKDGISDYDAKYVYNMNPLAPAITSVYEGKKISAADKILLGFDPKQSGLINIKKEEPSVSTAPIIPTYKINEVKLSADKKDVVIRGKALPNSFVTIYVYSTPIIVTVKTNNSGEWEYTMNKELDNGKHIVYAATVNDTGKIIAKSSGSIFVKTAESAGLEDIANITPNTSIEKPGLLSSNGIYFIIISIVGIFIIALLMTGIISKKDNNQVPPSAN